MIRIKHFLNFRSGWLKQIKDLMDRDNLSQHLGSYNWDDLDF